MQQQNKIDDGGPAFYGAGTGMSLRDWFAGLAMQGMISCDSYEVKPGMNVAQEAYLVADIMLKERGQ